MNIKNIAELNLIESGDAVSFDALLVSKEKKSKADETSYVYVIMQDASGTIEFPIWKDYDLVNNSIEEGKVYTVTGRIAFWEKKIQIKKWQHQKQM